MGIDGVAINEQARTGMRYSRLCESAKAKAPRRTGWAGSSGGTAACYGVRVPLHSRLLAATRCDTAASSPVDRAPSGITSKIWCFRAKQTSTSQAQRIRLQHTKCQVQVDPRNGGVPHKKDANFVCKLCNYALCKRTNASTPWGHPVGALKSGDFNGAEGPVRPSDELRILLLCLICATTKRFDSDLFPAL